MNRYSWKWKLKDLRSDKDVTVLSVFSCGGGSSMGYKRAGFRVIGNVEIDPKINKMYIKNNHPEHNFCMDVREFNRQQDLPEELFGIDILDGSPPCTTFSMAGDREETWGKQKKFREGQKKQTLDDLFFVFLDTAEKLHPKIVIAENVSGIIKGKAKGYTNEIVKRFRTLGYEVQIFLLNSATMDTPQARERVFFIANRMKYKPLKLAFKHTPIPFGIVRTKEGAPLGEGAKTTKSLLMNARPDENDLGEVSERLCGTRRMFTHKIVHDGRVCGCITANGGFYRFADKTILSDGDIRNVQSFPQDYDFDGNNVKYVCGMSVPPNMMANIATEIWEQWLS